MDTPMLSEYVDKHHVSTDADYDEMLCWFIFKFIREVGKKGSEVNKLFYRTPGFEPYVYSWIREEIESVVVVGDTIQIKHFGEPDCLPPNITQLVGLEVLRYETATCIHVLKYPKDVVSYLTGMFSVKRRLFATENMGG